VSRSYKGVPLDAKGSCGNCAHWKPKEGTAQFGVCQNWHGDFHGNTIPLSWGCPEWESRDTVDDDDDVTPVEIPKSLHRKRTQNGTED